MHTVDTVVLGAGHAGLAVSRLLTDAGREHVVLERGHVGERWRSERWDSLHLLTPTWMSRLPGWSYPGPDPEAFLPARSFVRYLDRYAAAFDAPVVARTTVESLTSAVGGAAGARDGEGAETMSSRTICPSSGVRSTTYATSAATRRAPAASAGSLTHTGTKSRRAQRRYHGVGRASSSTWSTKRARPASNISSSSPAATRA